MKQFWPEFVFGLLLIILLVFLVNPFPMYMPNTATMVILVCALLAFAIFGALVWRERATDEREVAHRSLAGRIGFLVGAVALAIGVLVQSLQHQLDPWLVIGLGVMVLGKLVGLVYVRLRR